MASQLRLKNTPQLSFAYDDTAERADRLERLLAEADDDELRWTPSPPSWLGAPSSCCARTSIPTATRSARSSAMQLALTQLGKDAVSYIAADEFPLPYEYRFLALEGLVTEVPADLRERTVVFLDCGNSTATRREALSARRAIVNIDHHHDNTCFGTRQPRRPGRVVDGGDRLDAARRRSA